MLQCNSYERKGYDRKCYSVIVTNVRVMIVRLRCNSYERKGYKCKVCHYMPQYEGYACKVCHYWRVALASV